MEEAFRLFEEMREERKWTTITKFCTILPRVTEEYPLIQMLSNTEHNFIYSVPQKNYRILIRVQNITLCDCKKIANCFCNMGFILVFYEKLSLLDFIDENNNFDRFLLADSTHTPLNTHLGKRKNVYTFLSTQRLKLFLSQPRMQQFFHQNSFKELPCQALQVLPRQVLLTKEEHMFLEDLFWKRAKNGYLIAWRWKNGNFFHVLKFIVFFI